MNVSLAILALAGAIAIGAASPGPSFVMVVRTAMAKSRADGLAAALGMGVGGVIFCSLALLGLHALFERAELLYLGFKILGGLYLIYLGFRMWRGAAQPIAVATDVNGGSRVIRSFLLGLATQLSNPKTLVFYGSIFAALMPPHVPGWTFLVVPPVIMAIETGWYTLVALAFSLPRPRSLYLKWKAGIDRVAGTLMTALGLKLIFSAARP
ncbi:MAG TPA: LysE family transporter [Candidatus Cybelea sp.]|nr:LysE family transporter [Candidatus Cybelea sp.]